jgi:hypothetical protein
MNMESVENPGVLKLRYPIGKFQAKEKYTINETLQSIEKLNRLPDLYIDTAALIKYKLNNTYREGGWTALQVVNHLVDVYTNALLRTKWLLTEENSILKPYDENEFSKLADSKYSDIDSTLLLFKLLIKRFVFLLASLSPESFNLNIYHPEYKADYSLHKLIDMYTWHGYHHLAHLEIIKNNS